MYALPVSSAEASTMLILLQGSRPGGVTSCQLAPPLVVSWTRPLSVPTQISPSRSVDGAMV